MNYYIDFEATQFKHKIISIGCVSDNGKTFQTLVKPVNKAKVDNFITELTGITKSMLENAPTADEAFNKFEANVKKYKDEDILRGNLGWQTQNGIVDVFRNRIMIPIHDEKGNPVGFSARRVDTSQEAKYVNTSETEIYIKGNFNQKKTQKTNDHSEFLSFSFYLAIIVSKIVNIVINWKEYIPIINCDSIDFFTTIFLLCIAVNNSGRNGIKYLP